ncbi:hypothetical protein T265_08298 [Opisthorchis viverrini]|uniref:Uncharacterized protein n=1 Tax=Opisthorchis viverrini TaxID=6198 RepID=A0A075A8V5_OPIVI|nr:hypothetical protein T265_08298 [Opisthorchis viverrini]KER23939.1 hypothetical protein T265_08298 [Opisthorchis viverrini]
MPIGLLLDSVQTQCRGPKTGITLLLWYAEWCQNGLSLNLKGRVYQATVLAALLHGCETWPIRAAELRRLQVFDNRCLRTIARRSMKEITKRLGAVGATRLPGWGPRDPHCAWLETLQDMAANRCQWRSCCQFLSRLPELSNKSWLYGSEASVLNADVSADFPTERSVVRIRPLPLDFPCLGLGDLAVSQPSYFFRHRKGAHGSNPTRSASRLPLSDSIPALVQPSGGMAFGHRKGAKAERFLRCEFNDRNAHGSNPTLASLMLLSRLEKNGSTSVLVGLSRGAAARHTKRKLDRCALRTSKDFQCSTIDVLGALPESGGNTGSAILKYVEWYSGETTHPR